MGRDVLVVDLQSGAQGLYRGVSYILVFRHQSTKQPPKPYTESYTPNTNMLFLVRTQILVFLLQVFMLGVSVFEHQNLLPRPHP